MPLYKKGDLILKEEACVSALLPNRMQTHCANCFASSWDGSGLQRCAKCALTYYCSRACQKADWPLHKGECSRLGRAGYLPCCAHPRLLLRLLACSSLDYRDFMPSSRARLNVYGAKHGDHIEKEYAELERFWGDGGAPISKADFALLFAEVCCSVLFCLISLLLR